MLTTRRRCRQAARWADVVEAEDGLAGFTDSTLTLELETLDAMSVLLLGSSFGGFRPKTPCCRRFSWSLLKFQFSKGEHYYVLAGP